MLAEHDKYSPCHARGLLAESSSRDAPPPPPSLVQNRRTRNAPSSATPRQNLRTLSSLCTRTCTTPAAALRRWSSGTRSFRPSIARKSATTRRPDCCNCERCWRCRPRVRSSLEARAVRVPIGLSILLDRIVDYVYCRIPVVGITE